MQIKKDDYLQLIMVDGNFRYGYVDKTLERGNVLVISLFEEGDSKLNFDKQSKGWELTFSATEEGNGLVLTETEKKLVPLLAQNLNSNEIADALGVAATTVRSEINLMRIKLHLQNKTQLVALCQGLADKLNEDKEEKEEDYFSNERFQ